MPPTDKIYGLHWNAAFGIPFAVLVAGIWLLVASLARAETNSLPPMPGVETFTLLDGSEATVDWASVTEVQEETPDGQTPPPTNIVLEANAEWELTFEWVSEIGSTDVEVYPIKIQVPFEHDQGFIYIRARQVSQ